MRMLVAVVLSVVSLSLAFLVNAPADSAADYEPLPPYGPTTVVPGFSTYVFVRWKQAPTVDPTTTQDYSIISAPAGWTISLPDLDKYKGTSWYRGSEPGVVLRISPPANLTVGSDDHGPREIVVQIKRNGVAVRQTVTVSLLAEYPTTRRFARLPQDPRLFWDILKKYQDNFVKYGTQYGASVYCQKAGTWEGGTWYYDGGRVFFQWADYSHDRSWYRQAGHALDVYRKYASDSKGAVPGWRVFTEGLKQDFLRNGREDSKDLVLAIAEKAAYHLTSTPFSALWNAGTIREVSYAVDSFLDAQELGAPEHPLLKAYVDLLIGYVQMMCVERTEPYVQPFMLALCSEALIKYYGKTQDRRIPGTIVAIANFCMNKAWVNRDQSWWYESYPFGKTPADAPSPQQGAADLNLLIIPLFSWLHRQTSDLAYLDVADHAFAGGVNRAWIGDGKHFSQNYRWSLTYVIPRKAIKDRPRNGAVPAATRTRERTTPPTGH